MHDRGPRPPRGRRPGCCYRPRAPATTAIGSAVRPCGKAAAMSAHTLTVEAAAPDNSSHERWHLRVPARERTQGSRRGLRASRKSPAARPPGRRPAHRDHRRTERPAFRFPRVRDAARGAADPQTRFHSPRGLSSETLSSLLVARSATVADGGPSLPAEATAAHAESEHRPSEACPFARNVPRPSLPHPPGAVSIGGRAGLLATASVRRRTRAAAGATLPERRRTSSLDRDAAASWFRAQGRRAPGRRRDAGGSRKGGLDG
jgi:hypothetical protein